MFTPALTCPLKLHYLLAYHALVVAQHDPCLHLIRQGPALVLPKHGLVAFNENIAREFNENIVVLKRETFARNLEIRPCDFQPQIATKSHRKSTTPKSQKKRLAFLV